MKITVWNISFCIVIFILNRFFDLILPGFVPGFAAVAVDLPYGAVTVLVVEVEATVAVPVEQLPAVVCFWLFVFGICDYLFLV